MKYLLFTIATLLIIALASIVYFTVDLYLGDYTIIAVGFAVIALIYFIYKKVTKHY